MRWVCGFNFYFFVVSSCVWQCARHETVALILKNVEFEGKETLRMAELGEYDAWMRRVVKAPTQVRTANAEGMTW